MEIKCELEIIKIRLIFIGIDVLGVVPELLTKSLNMMLMKTFLLKHSTSMFQHSDIFPFPFN